MLNLLLPLILFITLFRIYFLSLGTMNLFGDEAQYWTWAQELAFGYYSKPPMVAWLIKLTSSFCGESAFCLRLSSPVLHALTSLVLYALGRELYPENRKIAFWTSLTYLTLPAVILSSSLISTDPGLLFFWSLTLLFFVKATRQPHLKWWFFTGLAAGCGLLSKYNMLFFAPAALLYLLCSGWNIRRIFTHKGLWLTIAVASLLIFPNILWNLHHQFVTFKHTGDITKLHKDLFHPEEMLAFIGAQLFVGGPIFMVMLAVALFPLRKLRTRNDLLLLTCFWAVPFLIISTLSLLSDAEANWAAPMYISATLMVVAWAVEQHKKGLLVASFLLHIGFSLIFYTYDHLTEKLHIETKSQGAFWQKDPFSRIRGWEDLGKEVSEVLARYPDAALLSDDRKSLAELLYYVHPHPFNARKWTVDNAISSHYDLKMPMDKEDIGRNFILVTKTSEEGVASIQKRFAKSTLVKESAIPLKGDYVMRYRMYYMEGFKGY